MVNRGKNPKRASASPAKIAANRRNATKSTGPRSPEGKQRVSRNAFRHGLSLPVVRFPEADSAAEELAQHIAGENPTMARLHSARRLAEAKIDLERVRMARLSKLPLIPEVQQVLSQAEIDDFLWAARMLALNPLDRTAGDQMTRSRVLKYDRTLENRPVPIPAEIPEPARLERYERRAWARLKAAYREWAELESETVQID